MGPLSNNTKTEDKEWRRVEQSLREVRPEPLPLSQERAHTILENALAEASRRRASRPFPFFTSLFTVARVNYGLAGSVVAVAIVSFLFAGRAETTKTVLSEQRGVTLSLRDRPVENTPYNAPNIPIPPPKTRAASPTVVSNRESTIALRKKVRREHPVVRLQSINEFRRLATEPEAINRPVTLEAKRAYQEALFDSLPAQDIQQAPQEDTPRLLVVVSNEEPEVYLTVHNAPTTEVGYAEASAIHQAADGSLVWERCALQSGKPQPLFFQIQELGPSARDGIKATPPNIENIHRLDEGAKSERRLKIPEIEEIEYETKYRDTVLYWAGLAPSDVDWSSSAFRFSCACVCSGNPGGGGAKGRTANNAIHELERAGDKERTLDSLDAAGERSTE